MKYELAIFDLDGTILDTLEDLAASVNTALRQNGCQTRSVDEVRRFVGNGIRNLVDKAVPPDASQEQTLRVFADFKTHYRLHCMDKTRPYDGILALLQALRQAGVKTAVVSNKADFAVQTLVTQYFEGLFDAAVGEREGVRKKPAPDSVDAVLDTLGICRENACYIGDSEVDVQTAQNAGLCGIAVTWGFRSRELLEQSGAKTLAATPEELLACLQ